jgi:hypothetical protein
VTTYLLDVTLVPRYRLELLSAHATGQIMLFRRSDLVEGILFRVLEVKIALGAVVVLDGPLLVPLHVLLRIERFEAVLVRAFDGQEWLEYRRHDGRCLADLCAVQVLFGGGVWRARSLRTR